MARQEKVDRLMDMPPTRFRVVERGRRLEVIDTQARGSDALITPSAPPRHANPVQPPPGRARAGGLIPKPQLRVGRNRPPRTPKAARPVGTLSVTLDHRGNRVLTTASWMDEKAPRTLTIAGERADKQLTTAQTMLGIGFAIWVAVSIFLPVFWLAPAALAIPAVRRKARQQLTGWLDDLDYASTASSDG